MGSGIEWLRAGKEDWAKALILMRKFADQGGVIYGRSFGGSDEAGGIEAGLWL